MTHTVVAVYDSHEAAVHAVEELRHERFQPDQISIFAPDPREVEGYGDEVGVRVLQAGAGGAIAGGILGGVAGWLAGAAGLVVPGAGVVVAAGYVVAAVLGVIGGGSVGGLMGLLAGIGLPRRAAEEFERELTQGRTVVLVLADAEFGMAEVALGRAHPRALHRFAEEERAAA